MNVDPKPHGKHAKAMEIARRSFQKYADTYKELAERPILNGSMSRSCRP